ncbi:haloalkane dehalogenase-like [Styela clava]
MILCKNMYTRTLNLAGFLRQYQRVADFSKSASSHSSVKHSVIVKNSSMNYVDEGSSEVNSVVFLHGNPTSSYLWRNIYPKISSIARCFAPDLIGMGSSDKVNNLMYTFDDHFQYLSEWIDKVVKTDNIHFVIHDWGSVLGFHWSNLNRDRVKSIVHMEGIVAPLESWNEFPEGGRKAFQGMRSPAGEEMVLKKNFFVERILPSSIMTKLSDEDMEEYRKPFADPGEDRRPTLTWPREIPIKGDGPDNVIDIADSYYKWLCKSKNLPKLFIKSEPGFFSPLIEEKTKNWPNHITKSVKGHHFLQEDSPHEIAKNIHEFYNQIM